MEDVSGATRNKQRLAMEERCSIRFRALSGALSGDDPLCYVLEIDDVEILLDCGWRWPYNVEEIEERLSSGVLSSVGAGGLVVVVVVTSYLWCCEDAPVSLYYVYG